MKLLYVIGKLITLPIGIVLAILLDGILIFNDWLDELDNG